MSADLQQPGPIFIRGFSRSGGTLLVTVLDSHPAVAMSYELYPKLLTLDDGGPVDLAGLRDTLIKARNIKAAAKKIADRNVRIFVVRCLRGGLDSKRLANIVQDHLEAGMGAEAVASRLRLIERCCVAKMESQGKSRWGLKCSSQYEEYLVLWPNARFIDVVRDGRDVLASQLRLGSFGKGPSQVGEGWSKAHRRFRAFAAKTGACAREIFYEKLVRQPAHEVSSLCDFLGIPMDGSMLDFHKKDLTLFRASHLSMKRVSKPIDAASVGRWRQELSPAQLQEFYSTARETMLLLGYEE